MIRAVAVSVLLASLAAPAWASHPHQAVCTVSAKLADGEDVQFLVQTESSREYVTGDSSTDTHDFRYQLRICDDDNDSPSCSTYQSKSVTHKDSDEVVLVGMKKPSVVLFRGQFTSDGRMVGKLAHDHVLVPFTAKLDGCIGQSWVKLAPEASSNAY